MYFIKLEAFGGSVVCQERTLTPWKPAEPGCMNVYLVFTVVLNILVIFMWKPGDQVELPQANKL